MPMIHAIRESSWRPVAGAGAGGYSSRRPGTRRAAGGTAVLKDNIFLKILDKSIPARVVHEDELCVAFHDVNPQAPVHVLIIPRKVIPTHADVTPADKELLGHLHLVAA